MQSEPASKNLTYISTYDHDEKKLLFDCEHITFKTGTASNKRIESTILNKLYIAQLNKKEELRKKLKEVYGKFLESLLEFKVEMDALITFIAKIDILHTKVQLAIDFKYCCPEIHSEREKSFVDAKNMRHILIEHLQQQELYVPNDVKLGCGDQDGILLYGTNAVGKSSLIKSIGICIIMAQAGFFVPCEHFTYKPYHRLFTRILGNDNIFKGLSTFAVEMSELHLILMNACENSLILGDEVCSGTETTSAICIFLSALFTLQERKSSFIFATHLHEITDFHYLQELKSIALKHMAIHCDEDGIIVYDRKLKDGAGSKIYGLEVCKSLQMPIDFLTQAYKIRTEIGPHSSILSLHQSRYNSRKLKGTCEQCGAVAVDIHHRIPQKDADEGGFIDTFHKNHPANLESLCRECHLKETKNDTRRRIKKTNAAFRIAKAPK